MSGYELAAYGPAQRDDYLRLLRAAWGDAALSGAEFDWWFSGNPAGSLMSVARDDGRVMGVAAHSRYRMILGGEERLATFSVHATTDPAARGRGVFLGLERKHEDEAEAGGAAVVLARVLRGGAKVPALPPASPPREFKGPDGELLRLQDEAIALALEALRRP